MAIIDCACGAKRLEWIGRTNATILIVGDEPEDGDMEKGMPFMGKRGDVVSGELANVGISMSNVRLGFVRMHPATERCSGHLEEVIKEMAGRDGVLLMGAQTLLAFGIKSVMDKVGLCIYNPLFPKSAKFVMVTTSPPVTDVIGEFRMSLEKFSKKLKEVKNA